LYYFIQNKNIDEIILKKNMWTIPTIKKFNQNITQINHN